MKFKLGKRPTKIDKRTIRLKSILKELPLVPEKYLIDENLPVPVPLPMFANDRYGDCVIAGRAHQTLRFECKEQNQCISITDEEVLEEYFNLGCMLHRWLPWLHSDRGLVMLDALNDWRSDGWVVGGKVYDIYAFAAIDIIDHYDLRAAVYYLNGGYIGFSVPDSIWKQFDSNSTWDVVPGARIEGGHCILINGYNTVGPQAVSWGKQVQLTWAFWDTYCDEAYAIVDNRNNWMENSLIDVEKLDQILDEITN